MFPFLPGSLVRKAKDTAAGRDIEYYRLRASFKSRYTAPGGSSAARRVAIEINLKHLAVRRSHHAKGYF